MKSMAPDGRLAVGLSYGLDRAFPFCGTRTGFAWQAESISLLFYLVCIPLLTWHRRA